MMKIRKRAIMVVLSLIIFLILIAVIPMLVSPYRRPQGMVRNYILRITPLGTGIEDVIGILESRNDFGSLNISFERGFRPSQAAIDGSDDIGEMLVSTRLGSYRAWYKWFPLMTWGVRCFVDFRWRRAAN